MQISGSQTVWSEASDGEHTLEIQEQVPLRHESEGRADWRRIARASITDITIDPAPDPTTLAAFLNTLTVDYSSDAEPEGWLSALDDLIKDESGEPASMSPIVRINGDTYLQITDSPRDEGDLVWAQLDDDNAIKTRELASVVLFNDYSGDSPAVVECGRTANGAIVVASTDGSGSPEMFTLRSGSSPRAIIGALETSSIGGVADISGMVDRLLASGGTEFHKPEEEGDEWIDSVTVTLRVDEDLLGQLRQERASESSAGA